MVRKLIGAPAVLTLLAFLGGRRPEEIERVAWLAGCWEARSPHQTIEEQWMAPRGHAMLGVSRTVRGDSLVEYEVVVIREQRGMLAYEAHPSGQTAAVFLSRLLTDSSVVFENLQHDFPQRIGYERRGRDSLFAWVEGASGGSRLAFPYRRAGCGGP